MKSNIAKHFFRSNKLDTVWPLCTTQPCLSPNVFVVNKHFPFGLSFRPCFQAGRVTTSAKVALDRGSKIARCYKQNVSSRLILLPETTLAGFDLVS